jgi:hypothetical protein
MSHSEQVTPAAILMLCLFDSCRCTFDVPIVNHPNGFEDIPKGIIQVYARHGFLDGSDIAIWK